MADHQTYSVSIGGLQGSENLTLTVKVGLALLHVAETVVSTETVSVGETDVALCRGSLDINLGDVNGAVLAKADSAGATIDGEPVIRTSCTTDVAKVDSRDRGARLQA